jgi:hypothetical protein
VHSGNETSAVMGAIAAERNRRACLGYPENHRIVGRYTKFTAEYREILTRHRTR